MMALSPSPMPPSLLLIRYQPASSLIPTVYITEDCMQKPHKDLTEKLVKRIMQMNETNHIGNVHEIQIDCDYTSKSRATYYQFLETIKSQLSTIHYQLSTTIRLHQLSMPVPPVDYGVLMVYNTGDPRKWQERNPILDYRDVYPYLNKLVVSVTPCCSLPRLPMDTQHTERKDRAYH